MLTLEIRTLDSTNKDLLCDYYEKLEEEGLLSIFLYEDTSLQNFLDFCYKKWIYLCFLDDSLAGFTLFNNFCGKSAFFHFCMFKKGIPYTLDFGKMIFETVFRKNDLELIFGLTPKVYRHVFPVLEKIGMQKTFTIKEACRVRGRAREGIVSYISKEDFYKVKHSKNQEEKKDEGNYKDCL